MSEASNYGSWVARLRDSGLVRMPLSELPGDLADVRDGLTSAAEAVGMRLQTSVRGGSFLAWDADRMIDPDRLHAAMTAAVLLDLGVLDPRCPNCGTATEPSQRGWWCSVCDVAVVA